MTDSITTEIPPAFLPEDQQPKFVCGDCGLIFDNQMSLNGHLASHIHTPRVARKRKKEACPECGKMFVPGPGMASHRSKIHGVVGKRQDKPSNRKAEIPIASDIMQGVLVLVFPDGKLPLSALPALMKWGEATEQMLKEITA